MNSLKDISVSVFSLSRLRALGSIAFNTFRQAIRSKVLGALFFFALIVISLGFLFGQLSLHQEVRVSRDLALFATSIFSVITCTYSTISLFQRDIETRTVFTILSKPISRWQFPAGKFLGIALLNVCVVILLSAASYTVVLVQGGELQLADVAAVYTLFLQLSIVTALAILLATFSSGLLSGAIAIAVFIAGNLITQLELAAQNLEVELLSRLLLGLAEVLPGFEDLNLAVEATHGMAISVEYLLSATAYAALYTLFFLLIAFYIFAQKDFE